MQVEEYGKGFVVIGDTLPYRDNLKQLGCKWTRGLTINNKKTNAWFCFKKDEGEIKKFVVEQNRKLGSSGKIITVKTVGKVVEPDIKKPKFSLTDLDSMTAIGLYQHLISKNIEPKNVFASDRLTALQSLASAKRDIPEILKYLIRTKEYDANAITTYYDAALKKSKNAISQLRNITRLASEIIASIIDITADKRLLLYAELGKEIEPRASAYLTSLFKESSTTSSDTD